MIQKVQVHKNIFDNNEADKLAKQRANRQPIPMDLTPFHLIGPLVPLLSTNMMTQFEILNNIQETNIEIHKSLLHP